MTLKEIKETYALIENNHGGWSVIDKDAHSFIGTIEQDKTKFYFIGLPDTAPIRVKTLSDIQICGNNFLQECEKHWIDPRALDKSNNTGYCAALALVYLAHRLNWKTIGEFGGDGYQIVSDAFGCRIFVIKEDSDYRKDTTKFNVGFNGDWFSSSPEFNDYFAAMDWLRNLLSMTLSSVGIEFLGTIASNPDFFTDSKIEDVIMSKIHFSENGISRDELSMKQYLINVLEKELARLKEE